MIIIDIYETIKKTGVFSTWFGLADLHMLIDTDDKDAYQPLDYNAYQYLKYCAKEIKDNPGYYGKCYTYSAGDLTELERSSVRKVMRAGLHKNDTRAQDTIHKTVINDHIIPKIKVLTKDTKFIGGVAGNHMIEFSDDSRGMGYPNSEAMIIRRLGGEYAGEGLLLINYHIQLGGQRVLKKIIITHGIKGGSKASIVRELQTLHSLAGKIDWVVVAHAHDPFTGFYARYDFPDKKTGSISKHECLVTCLGSTRDGIKKGYDDYTERFMYTPSASRFPVAMFMAYKPMENNRSLDVKIRPLIM